MPIEYGKPNPYGKIANQQVSTSVDAHRSNMQRELEINQKLSIAIQELTGSQQTKAFRMALSMSDADELAKQAQHPALRDCLSQTSLYPHLQGISWLKD